MEIVFCRVRHLAAVFRVTNAALDTYLAHTSALTYAGKIVPNVIVRLVQIDATPE